MVIFPYPLLEPLEDLVRPDHLATSSNLETQEGASLQRRGLTLGPIDQELEFTFPTGRLPFRSWLQVVVVTCFHAWFSHRGLAPHPLGAHKSIHRNCRSALCLRIWKSSWMLDSLRAPFTAAIGDLDRSAKMFPMLVRNQRAGRIPLCREKSEN